MKDLGKILIILFAIFSFFYMLESIDFKRSGSKTGIEVLNALDSIDIKNRQFLIKMRIEMDQIEKDNIRRNDSIKKEIAKIMK